FAGTGASNNVESVKVHNLTKDLIVELAGTDILQLVLSSGINDRDLAQNKSLEVYPNPASDYVFIEFEFSGSDKATITVNDITGKELLRSDQYLETGRQQFRLNGLNSGTYLVKINIKDKVYTGKILSVSHKTSDILSIAKCENTPEQSENQTNLKKNDSEKAAKSTINMNYTAGDVLQFTGKSGAYATVVMLTPTQDQKITFDFVECRDADNNNYAVVKIGEQLWMQQNLNVGIKIDGKSIQTNNSIIEKYCYDNEETNCNDYGGIYQWDEIMQYVETEKTKGICPAGWHIPSDAEWKQLEMYLGMSQSEADKENAWRGTEEGGKLKEAGLVHWTSPNTGATNSSGFAALPVSYRNTDGSFSNVSRAYFWTSSHKGSGSAFNRYLVYDESQVYRGSNYRPYGFSVRCVKN
ncbi:MAG: T9SS type A sorting domain-containing protein, partial [Bacteroidales bacterium]|nr:T9SS type A sorting domain-containing protein [Bacteroidales bacterium]